MYTERWLTLFRILLSTLVLLGLLWLVLSSWPNAAHLNSAAGWSTGPERAKEELAPLFWPKETEFPAVYIATTA